MQYAFLQSEGADFIVTDCLHAHGQHTCVRACLQACRRVDLVPTCCTVTHGDAGLHRGMRCESQPCPPSMLPCPRERKGFGSERKRFIGAEQDTPPGPGSYDRGLTMGLAHGSMSRKGYGPMVSVGRRFRTERAYYTGGAPGCGPRLRLATRLGMSSWGRGGAQPRWRTCSKVSSSHLSTKP